MANTNTTTGRADMLAKAEKAVLRARANMLLIEPFWGTLAIRLGLEWRDDIKTAATDGERLFCNPEYALSLTEPELIGLLAHEVSHCTNRHPMRLGKRDLARANRAADYAINRDLRAAGFVLFPGHLYDARFDGLAFEEIYAVLTKEEADASQPKQGQPDAGNGQPGQDASQPGNGQPADASQPGNDQGQGNGQPDAGSQPADASAAGQGQGSQPGDSGQPGAGTGASAAAGQPGDGAGNGGQPGTGTPASGQPGTAGAGNGQPGTGQGQPGPGDASGNPYGEGGFMAPKGGEAAARALESEWEIATRQAVAIAKRANAGNVPGHLQDLVTDLAAPRVDVADLLAEWIDSRMVAYSTFSSPNRRFVHSGTYLPGAVRDALGHVVFIGDTSGSNSAEEIRGACSEVVAALEAGKIDKLTMVWADVAVRHVQEFERGDDVQLTPRGGGGTRFDRALEWVEENAPDAAAIIYLTDADDNGRNGKNGRDSIWGVEPSVPLLWLIHGDSRKYAERAANVPFGEPVYYGRI